MPLTLIALHLGRAKSATARQLLEPGLDRCPLSYARLVVIPLFGMAWGLGVRIWKVP